MALRSNCTGLSSWRRPLLNLNPPLLQETSIQSAHYPQHVLCECDPQLESNQSRKKVFQIIKSVFQEQLRKVIQIPEFIWKVFDCEIRNPGLWNPESSSRNPESGQWLEFRIQVPLTWNPESNFPLTRIWNPASKTAMDNLTWGTKTVTGQITRKSSRPKLNC